MQLRNFEGSSGQSPLSLAKSTIKRDGILALYRGLDAGLVRQLTYSTGRLGIFRLLCDYCRAKSVSPQGCQQTRYLPFGVKALLGLISGGVASFICNPTDLALVRLQTNSMLPVSQRKNYSNVVQAFRYIIREEGFFSMWRGSMPSVVRAMSINMGMLATYDQFNEAYFRWVGSERHSALAKVVSSVLSGAVASLVSLPFDIMKTQIQKQSADQDSAGSAVRQKGQSRSSYRRIAAHIYQSQGLGGFFRGYLTYYFRIAPHVTLTLLCMDWLDRKF